MFLLQDLKIMVIVVIFFIIVICLNILLRAMKIFGWRGLFCRCWKIFVISFDVWKWFVHIFHHEIILYHSILLIMLELLLYLSLVILVIFKFSSNIGLLLRTLTYI